MTGNVLDVKARHKEYATFRVTIRMLEDVQKMANEERRTLSQMLRILVEEALDARGKVSQSKAAD